MITVLTEHTNLVRTKAKVVAHGHVADNAVDTIIAAINRALGDTRAQLRTAIDALPDVAMRMHADRALQALDAHASAEAHLDAILEGAALLGADVDVDYEVARMRSQRETNGADLTRNLAVLVHALADSRVDAGAAEGPAPCDDCGGIGEHYLVRVDDGDARKCLNDPVHS
jgi:hypothetical protein